MDTRICKAIASISKDNELSCAEAFEICRQLGVEPKEVGMACNELKVRLVKCRLGLFGFGQTKKIIRPQKPGDEELAKSLLDSAQEGRISCEKLWNIAKECNVTRQDAANACEYYSIKIKPCQLGAF